jgi:DNA-binding transcriptional MocR family regulator
MGCLENALNKMLSPEKHIDIPETGFFSCLNFRDLPNNFKLSEELAKKKVNLLNIGDHYLPENIRSNMFRISVCKVSKEQICKGVGIISETLKKAVKS